MKDIQSLHFNAILSSQKTFILDEDDENELDHIFLEMTAAKKSAQITEDIAVDFAEWLMQTILDTPDLSKNNVDVLLSTRQLFKIFLEQTN